MLAGPSRDASSMRPADEERRWFRKYRASAADDTRILFRRQCSVLPATAGRFALGGVFVPRGTDAATCAMAGQTFADTRQTSFKATCANA